MSYQTAMRDHEEAIASISQKVLGVVPTSVARMGHGICNDVYSVSVGGRELIFRLKDQPRYLLGSHNHIPIFRCKGIPVPEIVAEDYSKSEFPFAYQVQTKLPGTDIKDVIHTLSDEQLRAVAGEIANVFIRLTDVPNNGKFGVLWGDDRDLVDSWAAEVARVTKVVIGWGRRTGIMEPEFQDILLWINQNYKGYFDRVRPTTYFGDICQKNVMIHEGRFSGLVDLDSLAQGDPLEAIGRIKASWYGTHYGEVYTEAVMDALQLSPEARRLVTMYATLNRTFWIFENGIQFNRNTSPVVDRQKEAEDKSIVRALMKELVAEQPRMEVVTAPVSGNGSPTVRKGSPPPPSEVGTSDLTPASAAAYMSSGEARMVSSTFREDPGRALTHVRASETALARQAGPEAAVATNGRRKVVLEALGLSKTYVSDGIGFDALKDVDIKIHRGECVAIVGKSGSGKSTLMHLLACLDAPSEGYVYVDGDDTSEMTESLKNVLRNEQFGFVFQQFFLNGRDTVFENVVLPMRIRGAATDELEMEAREALAAVGLADKVHKKAKDLSGGEKQRVCIARALIGKPKVIFADEPTGNLDSATGAAVEQLLFELNRRKNITLVIVTHDADLAAKCDRIIEMKDGRVIGDTRRGGELQ